MTHGAMIAIHAAAAAARARTHALDAFRVRGATAPERARPLVDLGLTADDRALRGLLAEGVVRAVDARGRATVIGDDFARVAGYYLDEAAFVAQRDRGGSGGPERARTRARILAVLAAALAALGAGLLLSLGRGGG